MLERDVAPGIHRVADAFVNWYVVEADDGLTVVDAGVPRSWASLHDLLRALGRPIADVKALLLTHAHFDHVGFAERLRSRHGVPVHVHGADEPLTRHPLRFKTERLPLLYFRNATIVKAYATMIAQGALWAPRLATVEVFGDDAGELPVPGRPRVVPTPGHTYGHVSFHLPERDAVIAGDALVTLDPYTGRAGPRPVARGATADSGRALASLQRFAELGVTHLLPGHGEPWHDGSAEAAARAQRSGIG